MTRAPRRVLAALAAVATLCAGCSDDGDSTAEPDPESTTTAAGAPSSPSSSSSSSSSSTTSTTLPAAEPDGLLGRDGLGFAILGEGEDETLASLRQGLGAPTKDGPLTAEACDTGADRQVEWGDLVTYFGDEADRRTFFGWAYGTGTGFGSGGPAPSPKLTTPEGVTVGSKVSAVKTAYGKRLKLVPEDGETGPSFVVNNDQGQPSGFGGAMTGLKDSDTVTQLSGGLICP